MSTVGRCRLLGTTMYRQAFGVVLPSSRYTVCSRRIFSAFSSKSESHNANQNEVNGEEKSKEETEVEKLLAEKDSVIGEKEKEVKELKDKYLRALAENENIMTRNKKLMDDARLYGIQSFAKDLLEVADILEKATESVPKEELDKNTHLKSLYEGLTMTDTQLQKVFKSHGVEKINPTGEKFDPNFHDAMFMQPFPEKEPGTVAVVTKIGYTLNGRPLRAALVGVVQ